MATTKEMLLEIIASMPDEVTTETVVEDVIPEEQPENGEVDNGERNASNAEAADVDTATAEPTPDAVDLTVVTPADSVNTELMARIALLEQRIADLEGSITVVKSDLAVAITDIGNVSSMFRQYGEQLGVSDTVKAPQIAPVDALIRKY